MEHWQLVVLQNNYPTLLTDTILSVSFLAELLKNRAISRAEQTNLDAQKVLQPAEAVQATYRILETKTRGFDALICALKNTGQTGVLKILTDAARKRYVQQTGSAQNSDSARTTNAHTNVPHRSIIDVIGLLEYGHEIFNPDEIPEQVILLLGNTGSGKTTFGQTIAGDLTKLRVITAGKRGKSYIIDEDEKISRPSILSSTFLPELLHLEENIFIYDCPGFNDTRGPEEDVAANYFLNQIIKKAKSVKFVFVLSYTTMQERLDFPLLAKHATQFIADIQKYSHSIGIVFTKTPNFDGGGGEPISNEGIFEEIAEFLQNCKRDFETSLRTCKIDERELVEQQLQFVNCLLNRHNTQTSSSPIFFSRQPKKGVELLVNCDNAHYTKSNVGYFLEGLEYSDIDPTDFRYTVKAEAFPHLQKIVENVNRDIASNMHSNLEEFCEWFQNEKLPSNSTTVTQKATCTYETWAELNTCLATINEQRESLEPLEYYRLIADCMNRVSYSMAESLGTFIQRVTEYFSFLDDISSRKVIRNVDDWTRPVREALSKIEVVKNWYEFCSKLETDVHSYRFQTKKSDGNIPATGREMLNYVNTRVMTVEDHVLQNVALLKPADLEQILNIMMFAMRKTEVSVEDGVVTVVGNFVRFGEFVNESGVVAGERLHVFSMDSIFIDVDLRHPGLQVTIVSPNIYVIGERNVDVSGHSGAEIVPSVAAAGSAPSGAGANGIPGNPGYPGGPVYLFTNNIIDATYLKVTSNGGIGSRGQSGGHGANGQDGRDATENDASHVGTYDNVVVFKRDRYKHPGFPGGSGGNGGHGGVGGLGGTAGEVTVTCLTITEGGVQTFTCSGKNNAGGVGGTGGNGGRNGYGISIHKKTGTAGIGDSETCVLVKPASLFASNGSNGLDDHIREGLQYPIPASHVDTDELGAQCRRILERQTCSELKYNKMLEVVNQI